MPTRSPGSRPERRQPAAEAGHLARAGRRRSWLAAGDQRDRGVGVGVDDRGQVHVGSPAQVGRRRRPTAGRAAQAGVPVRPDHPGDARSSVPRAWPRPLVPGRSRPWPCSAGWVRAPAPRSAAAGAPSTGRTAAAAAPPTRARSPSSSTAINSLRAVEGPAASSRCTASSPASPGAGPTRWCANGADHPQPEPRLPGERQLDEARRERRRRLRRRRR